MLSQVVARLHVPSHNSIKIHSIQSSLVHAVRLSSALMILHTPLQPLCDLDRGSPQFHEQLAAFLGGNEYQVIFPTLHGDDLTWLVEYLDSVSIQSPSSHSALR